MECSEGRANVMDMIIGQILQRLDRLEEREQEFRQKIGDLQHVVETLASNDRALEDLYTRLKAEREGEKKR
tara:strand:- start:643 stop:855 length:213 start_codon:yes stop_codon:yes gene_type:complete